MNRIRAAAITIRGDELLVMFRKRDGKEYVTFPGGGVEENETVEQAVVREIKEETSMQVSIQKLLYHQVYSDGHEEYFYLCDYISGEPKLEDDSIEKGLLSENNYFNPGWVPVESIRGMLLYPTKIRDRLLQDYANGFRDVSEGVIIKTEEV